MEDKFPRMFHFPGSPGTTSDDRIATDISHIYEEGEEWVATEKLDGSNTDLTRGGVYGRSHIEYTQNPWDKKIIELHSMIKDSISEGLDLFGEGMTAIHSIEYEHLTSHFYLFAARYKGIWSEWSEVEDYAYLLELPTVPVLFKGKIESERHLKELTKEITSQPSVLGGQREGFVLRVARSFKDEDFSKSVFKWVRKGHVKTDEHWTRNWRRAKINYKTY